jgi:hypothetical protein
MPERRLNVDVGASFEFGRDFTRTISRTLLQWFPQATGGDYETTAKFWFGRLGGPAPFDEMFILGLDRDHDLILRGHSGTNGGRKGAGPAGAGFLLANIDLQKTVFQHGLFMLGAGPYIDLASVRGHHDHFVDTGIEVRVSFLSGLILNFSYGRDLQSGRDAFFYR